MAWFGSRPSVIALLAASLVTTIASGCGTFRRIAGTDVVNLEKADVQEMSVDLRRQQKTICPRESVQMAVFAKVALEGETAAKPFETWQGHGDVNKNDKLDFVDFAFHSEQGAFDRDGWFQPSRDLTLTAGKEFEIKSVYRRRPDKFTFTTTYKPDYTCIRSSGGSGPSGSSGESGHAGSEGRSGQSGSSSRAGSVGGDGGTGTNGNAGTNGGPGPRLVVYATMVKTPFYEKLLALQVTGDVDDFLLVPDGQAVTISAHGGPGGPGGAGGPGGRGGSGGSGNPGANGGKGGNGGNGGQGGNGGPGGSIELVYDARYPGIAGQVHLDASGGSAGPGGSGGSAGDGGYGGSGQTPSGSSGTTPPPAPSGQSGSSGSSGTRGTDGHGGAEGQTKARSGEVNDRFAGKAAITPLDASPPASAAGSAAPAPTPATAPPPPPPAASAEAPSPPETPPTTDPPPNAKKKPKKKAKAKKP